MKHRKRMFFMTLYLMFTFGCGIAGWILKEERNRVFNLWFFASSAIWFVLWIQSVILMCKSDKRKHESSAGLSNSAGVGRHASHTAKNG